MDNKDREFLDKTKYVSLFENAPVAIWEEDFSQVKAYLNNLKKEGVEDLREYFKNNSTEVARLADKVRIIDVNRAAIELYNAKSKEELISAGLKKVFTGRSYEQFLEEILAFYSGLTQVEKEIENKTLDGTTLYLMIRFIIPFGFEETWERVFVSTVDVTHKKRAEIDLREEKDVKDLIISSMGEGLLVVDKDHSISMINSTAEKLLDLKEKDVIGKKWHEVTKAYEADKEIPFGKRVSVKVLKKGATKTTKLKDDHYYLTITGRKFPVTSVTTPIISGGEVIGTVKVFRDVTEEKERDIIIEQTVKSRTSQVKEEQEKSHSILENTTEGVVLTNDRGLVDYVNPAFTNMTGYKPNDLKRKEFSSTIKGYTLQKKPVEPRYLSDAAAVTATSQKNKILIEKKGSKKKLAVVISSAPVRVGGEFKGVVRVFHDFSEDLKLQQQKDDFFSIASHELRTPLSVISGNLDTVLSGYGKSSLSDVDKQLLRDSLASTSGLIKMVNDFLNVSRLDQGRLKYDIKPMDICKITKEVNNELKTLAEDKGIEFRYACEGKHGLVMGDEGLLKEILINLIGNSLKFTEKGSITVDHSMAEGRIVVRVIDTGMGIDKDKQGILFQRFQQAMDKTLSRVAGGTGLGLYISRQFAQVMGGDLILEKSEPGKGSTFRLTLPLVQNDQ